ncbi:MAG TPA: zinc finger-like domain-containing protein, partial [Planctomycetota bacterium]|nr:zinc finger-like domain-containing protein [Planctomycetota bacterium]
PAAAGPTWNDLNKGIAAFVTILDTLNPTQPPPADKTDAALAELGKFIPFASTDLAPLAYGAYGTLRMVRHGIWILAEDEVAALQEYVRTQLSKPATLSDTVAIEFLVKSYTQLRASLPGERRSGLRWIALAHIERLVSNGYKTRVKLSPQEVDLLGLVPQSDYWVTAESKVKDELAALGPEGLDKKMTELLARPEPEVQILAIRSLLLRAFESFGPDQIAFIEEMKKRAATFDVGSAEIRDEMARIRNGLSKIKPCSRCKGTHETKCTNGCNENGEFVKVCGHCQGTGRVMYQGRDIPCPNRQMEGDHRQATKCTKCKGNKRAECKSCREPWKPPTLDSMVKAVPCALCNQGGFLRGYLRLPCPDCFGVGKKFEAPK